MKSIAIFTYLLIFFSISSAFSQIDGKIEGSWMLKHEETGTPIWHIDVWEKNDKYYAQIAGILVKEGDANVVACPDRSRIKAESIKIIRGIKKDPNTNSTFGEDAYWTGKWFDVRNCQVEHCIVWFNKDNTEMYIRNKLASELNPNAVITLYKMANPPNKEGIDKI